MAVIVSHRTQARMTRPRIAMNFFITLDFGGHIIEFTFRLRIEIETNDSEIKVFDASCESPFDIVNKRKTLFGTESDPMFMDVKFKLKPSLEERVIGELAICLGETPVLAAESAKKRCEATKLRTGKEDTVFTPELILRAFEVVKKNHELGDDRVKGRLPI